MTSKKNKQLTDSSTCGECVCFIVKWINNEQTCICSLHSYFSPFIVKKNQKALCTGFRKSS